MSRGDTLVYEGPRGMQLAGVLSALGQREGEWLNRYQVAVACREPANQLVEILEGLVRAEVIAGTGEISDENSRFYRFDGPTTLLVEVGVPARLDGVR